LGVLSQLEELVRALASQKGSISVVCGPIVDDTIHTIGSNKVVVPQRFFKALLQNNHNKWQAIGFVVDNQSGKRPLSTYALSINELQEITGITFFPALPNDIAENVKSQVDFSQWMVAR
jgi:endonuclease G